MNLRATFLLFFLINTLCAQTASPGQKLLAHVNERISGIDRGWFDCTSVWKSATKTDTAIHAGRIFFFRSPSDKDSIGRFVLKHADGRWRAYDGHAYYTVTPEKKQIVGQVVDAEKHIRKLAASHRDGRLLFFPLLYGPERAPFIAERLRHAQIDSIALDGKRVVRLTRRDSALNVNKLMPADPNVVRITETYDFSLPDLALRQFTSHIVFTEQPQYQETRLSPIHALPDSTGFEAVFRLDSLLTAGYTLTWSQQAPRRTASASGDTLPVVVLRDIGNASVSTGNLPGRLVLLDFWYKNCAPCVQALPALERLHERYGPRGLRVIGVNVHDRDTTDLAAFIRKMGIHYPVWLDTERQLSRALALSAYPTMLLVDPRTRTVLHYRQGYGPAAEADLAARVEAALDRD